MVCKINYAARTEICRTTNLHPNLNFAILKFELLKNYNILQIAGGGSSLHAARKLRPETLHFL